tara:strand:+ start:477 stop:1127 length:651 start_codon:yes stop_codon:yes gene_type:complete
MSKLETNQVDPATGTTLTLGTSGDTVTVPTGVGLTATDEVKSNKISPATGTALQIGDSGDTITVPSGATITNSGTATGFGGDNTPSFVVYKSGDQTGVSAGTWTKVTGYAEIYDTDNTFASDKFVAPSAGKYFLYCTSFYTGSTDDLIWIAIRKNNNTVAKMGRTMAAGDNIPLQLSAIVEASASDYFEQYIWMESSGTIYSSGTEMRFGGFKLIT